MTVEAAGLFLDYSKNRIIDQTIKLLLQLANVSCLRERIGAMFAYSTVALTQANTEVAPYTAGSPHAARKTR
jgi:glucose-6-phosphate isomerase